MDQESAEVNAIEEMEESSEVPKDYDQIRLQTARSSQDVGQNEQMAIGQQDRRSLHHEYKMVQTAGSNFPGRFHQETS